MSNLAELNWLSAPCAPICEASQTAARQHQASLTKPPGALGVLETLAEQFAGWQGCAQPKLDRIAVRVYAGDHGICAQQVSAFPQSVTAQMIDNFIAGGAAINVLSRAMGADFDLLNLGTVSNPASLKPQQNLQIAPGTQDCTAREAMTEAQLATALDAGRNSVLQLIGANPQLFIGGEMGIGNTSSASLIYALLLDLPVTETTGPGTGLDPAGVEHKRSVLRRAVNRHRHRLNADTHPALACLRCVGGLEIAALTGAYLTAAQQGIPIMVDGFIATAAWLAAVKLQPQLSQWSLFSHCSVETAHRRVLQQLGVTPLLNLGMRLGEGSGAAMAVPIVQNALKLHAQMATFISAGVDGSTR